MDILLPPIIRIGDRFYRKNPSRHSSNTIPIGHLEEQFFVDCRDADYGDRRTESDSKRSISLLKPVQVEGGNYVGLIYVPKLLHKAIAGTQKATQRKIEEDLKCKLTIPNSSSTDTHIKIITNSENSIEAVVNRIDWIVTEARRNHPPSHFVCLPVLNQNLQNAFCLFKDQVLKNVSVGSGDYDSVDKDLFVSEKKLHFTMATLFLADENEVLCASQMLGNFLNTESGKLLANNCPLRLTIRGFDCMNDDPKFVRVLHATLVDNDESRRLQIISNGLADMFTECGFHSGNRRPGDPVKLHLTVLNSRLRCQRLAFRCPPEIADTIKSEPFCAVGILRDFNNRSLVEDCPFEEFQLCSLLQEADSNVSFYPCDAKLNWVCDR